MTTPRDSKNVKTKNEFLFDWFPNAYEFIFHKLNLAKNMLLWDFDINKKTLLETKPDALIRMRDLF